MKLLARLLVALALIGSAAAQINSNSPIVLANPPSLAGVGGAPSDAPYYVTTANGSLSAEVVPSANVQTLLGAADFAAFRTSLGLTSLATTTPGTGVATALAVNVGSAGAPVLFNGAGGTPSSLVLTNATGDKTGTATNDDAAAGKVGEFVSCSGTCAGGLTGTITGLTSGAAAVDAAAVSLTAGDWQVSAVYGTLGTATTSYTRLLGSINTTANTANATFGYYANMATGAIVPGAALVLTLHQAPVRFSFAGTTTVYCNIRATFTVSTADGFCRIEARRVR